jgi:hypothetical protein
MVRFVTRNNERILIMSISTQLDYFKWSKLTTLEKEGGKRLWK